jgi:hypothetical protein
MTHRWECVIQYSVTGKILEGKVWGVVLSVVVRFTNGTGPHGTHPFVPLDGFPMRQIHSTFDKIRDCKGAKMRGEYDVNFWFPIRKGPSPPPPLRDSLPCRIEILLSETSIDDSKVLSCPSNFLNSMLSIIDILHPRFNHGRNR